MEECINRYVFNTNLMNKFSRLPTNLVIKFSAHIIYKTTVSY